MAEHGEAAAPYAAHVITSSDRAYHGVYDDQSGSAVAGWLEQHGFAPIGRSLVPDEADQLRSRLEQLMALPPSLIVVTGGTGLGPRDVTPQVLDGWAEYAIPGFGELLREGSRRYSLNAYLSRCGGWVKQRTLILALPGSPKAVTEQLGILADLLPHALRSMRGQCDHRRKIVDQS